MCFYYFSNNKLCYYERGDILEGRVYNFMGSRNTDENLPDQDLSSTTESNFNDVNAETSEPDSQDDFLLITLLALQLILNKIIITALL